MFPDLPQQLALVLQEGRRFPAERARFAPQLAYGRHEGPAAADARPAAVMLLLFPREGRWRLPLTVRQSSLADHAGQVSLPGGMLEPGESAQAGAMRELAEELGVDSPSIHLIGSLTSLYVFNSNFLVTPWLAYLPSPPVFQPNPAEVADVFELPLSTLLDGRSLAHVEIQHGALCYSAPCIRCSEHKIWGATSMILAEFRALLRAVLGLDLLSPGSPPPLDL
jgi:8-oxo-dGTP pyrophosphatase MutT (NUDIX family)